MLHIMQNNNKTPLGRQESNLSLVFFKTIKKISKTRLTNKILIRKNFSPVKNALKNQLKKATF